MSEIVAGPKLYALALYATRQQLSPQGLEVEVGLEAFALGAHSEKHGYEAGMRKALEAWPKSDGWIGHTVRVIEVNIEKHYTVTTENDPHPERVM